MSRGIAAAGVGPILSSLCFVHCVGFATLAPVLPGALGLMAGATWIEPSLWAVSVVACGFALKRGRATTGAILAWLVASATGTAGIAAQEESLVRVGLGAIVLVQVATIALRWRTHRASCVECQACNEGSRT